LYVDNLTFTGSVAGIADIADSKAISVYPNPASDIVTFTIVNTNKADMTLNIYNTVGKLIRSETLQQNQRQFSVGVLRDGIYIIEIKSKEWTGKQKLIIQR
jgi:hypothetical protein